MQSRIIKPLLIVALLILTTCNNSVPEQKTAITPELIHSNINLNELKIGSRHFSNLYQTIFDHNQKSEKKLKINFIKKNTLKELITAFKEKKLDILSLPLNNRETWKLIQDKDSSIIFLSGWSSGNHLLSSNMNYLTLKNFPGSKIACIKGSPEYYTTKLFLDMNNIDPDSVKWEFVKSNAQAFELLSKTNVIAVAVDILNLKENQEEKFHTLYSSSASVKYSPEIIITSKDLLITHKSKLKTFISGFLTANNHYLREKQRKSRRRSKKKSESKIAISNQEGCFIPASYSDNRDFFRLSKKQGADFYKLSRTFFKYDNRLDKSGTLLKESVDTSLLVSLYKTFHRFPKDSRQKFKKKIPENYSKFSIDRKVAFKENNSKLTLDMYNTVKEFVFLADIFFNHKIKITAAMHPDKTLTYKRIELLRKVLSKRYQISSSRLKITVEENQTSELKGVDTFKLSLNSK